MSLIRNYWNDPFFGVEPHHQHLNRRRQNAYDALDSLVRQQDSLFSAFSDLFNAPMIRSPPVELREDGSEYIVEAELPGVRKEDLDVRVGEGGRSLTIEGKVFRRSGGAEDTTPAPQTPRATTSPDQSPAQATEKVNGTEPANEGTVAKTGSKDVAKKENTESFSTYSSTFSRTFQFPRPVDGSRVQARLADGLLSLRIPQLEDTKGVKVIIS